MMPVNTLQRLLSAREAAPWHTLKGTGASEDGHQSGLRGVWTVSVQRGHVQEGEPSLDSGAYSSSSVLHGWFVFFTFLHDWYALLCSKNNFDTFPWYSKASTLSASRRGALILDCFLLGSFSVEVTSSPLQGSLCTQSRIQIPPLSLKAMWPWTPVPQG